MSITERLATLSDLARLRMLRLLERHELSVGELARALQIPQSTVSRHLKHLHTGGWVAKRAEGTASLYQLQSESLAPGMAELWALAREQLGESPTLTGDDARMTEVLAERRTNTREFFGRLRGEWDDVRRHLFGDGFTPKALMGLLPSEAVIADLGCGTGNAAEYLAPYVEQVIAVDREPEMLAAARKRLSEYSNIDFREGELTALPIDDAALDAALILLVLHHLEDPAAAVAEAARTLKPGGRLLIVDMVAHDHDDYRQTMGHQWLGFSETDVSDWALRAGLRVQSMRTLRPNTDAHGPGLFVAVLS